MPAGAGWIVRKVLSVTARVTPKMRAKTMRRALAMILAMQNMPVKTTRELSGIMLAMEERMSVITIKELSKMDAATRIRLSLVVP